SQVRFVIDAAMVQDEYVLTYEYAEDISRIEWTLIAPSRIQKAQDGSYDIADNGDGTSTVTYTLSVELAMSMLRMFKRKAEKAIMATARRDLKKGGRSTAAGEWAAWIPIRSGTRPSASSPPLSRPC